jgi:hypothetical protein
MDLFDLGLPGRARGVTISNVGNGMVLDAEDCELANGTVVRQWAQLDYVCQQWDIAPAS